MPRSIHARPLRVAGASQSARPRAARLAGVAAGACALVVLSVPASGRAPGALVITGARVLDTVAGRYLEAATVVIDGGRISRVAMKAAAAGAPADAERLDLPGVTLVPGLADAHASLAPSEDADADYHAALSLAHGVTMVRNVGVRLPWAVAERERVRSGDVLAPLLWTSGPTLAERGTGSFSIREVFDADAAGREVGAQAAAGVDWIVVDASTGAEVYQAVIRAARATKLRVSGRPGATSMAQLARLGVDAIDGLDCPARTRDEYAQVLAARPVQPPARPLSESIWSGLAPEDARAAIAQMARGRTVLVPLLAGSLEDLQPDDVVRDEATALLPRAARDRLTAAVQDQASAPARAAAWRARARLVKDFAAAGGTIVTGTDFRGSGFGLPGGGVLKELTLLVRAGLTPAQAIRAATVNAATMLGAAQAAGQIKAGYQADLFGVEGDPLRRIDDLGRIRLIVRGGEVLDRQQLIAQARRALTDARR